MQEQAKEKVNNKKYTSANRKLRKGKAGNEHAGNNLICTIVRLKTMRPFWKGFLRIRKNSSPKWVF